MRPDAIIKLRVHVMGLKNPHFKKALRVVEGSHVSNGYQRIWRY